MEDTVKTAELIADRYFQRGLEPERREHLIDDISGALTAERARAALSSTPSADDLTGRISALMMTANTLFSMIATDLTDTQLEEIYDTYKSNMLELAAEARRQAAN
jgi:hypothetical protein